MSWYGVDLPAVVAQAGDGLAEDITLVVVTPGTPTAGQLAGGTNPTTANKTARGYVAHYDERQVDGTVIHAGDRLVVLFANSIQDGAIPKPNDRVTLFGVTYRIVKDGVARDPAGATYELHVRR